MTECLQIKKPDLKQAGQYGISKGSRTPVAGMKTRCPRPLDDGDVKHYLWESPINIAAARELFKSKANFF